MQIGPQNQPIDPPDQMQEMMMIVPVNRDVDKTHDIADENRGRRRQVVKAGAVRHNSSTMIVMMMAMTPSLNASSRSFSTASSLRRTAGGNDRRRNAAVKEFSQAGAACRTDQFEAPGVSRLVIR